MKKLMREEMKRLPGAFVISLDFEIMWGVRDKPGVQSYYLNNLLGVHQVIPALLRLFSEYGIHGTFATVGMLFAASKAELLQYIPAVKPAYANANLSPYNGHLEQVGSDEASDPLHFGADLIKQIRQTPQQEIGSHTFCHYYCLEQGQTIQAFEADLQAAIAIAKAKGLVLKSLVFPRNQFNNAYLEILKRNGFNSYRGNEASWMYAAKSREQETPWRRLARIADTYIDLSGHNVYRWEDLAKTGPLYNIPASRFLRPYNKTLKKLEHLRLRRIKDDMTVAARQGSLYHLWWHPHNFGVNLQENLDFITAVLKHYQVLQQRYSFESLTMSEVTTKLSAHTYVPTKA
jgi:peptidoglycan/xylan/chitin deacetylase (PgdA/CDA1 family)